jgi:hypothetical protein
MTDAEFSDAIGRWAKDPVLFVRQMFGTKPDKWQAKALRAVRTKPRVAMSACKGPGKSCLLAWIVWWFLLCHVDAQIMCVSVTRDNLTDNLWKEIAKWMAKCEWLSEYFELLGERIINRKSPKTWWCSARAFPKSASVEEQANTLAGFHADNIMVVLDEIGDYPPGVLPAAEAIFANATNAHLVVAGNPTNVLGPLGQIVKVMYKRWHIVFISGDPDDSDRSPRISLKWAREQIEDHGRDDPWVMVNVLGLFPPKGINQLIDVNDVIEAQKRDMPALAYRGEARVWGLDPARFGDDESVLAKRQGVLGRKMQIWRGLDGTELGNAVARALSESAKEGEPIDTLFVDVGGVGSSAYDRLGVLGWGHILVPVDFGSRPDDGKYLNKRAEMWALMAQWVKRPTSCLPNDPVLRAELTAPTFGYKVVNKRTKFVLESKDQMKARGVASPNRADALALTWAATVMPRSHLEIEAESRSTRIETDYNPLG